MPTTIKARDLRPGHYFRVLARKDPGNVVPIPASEPGSWAEVLIAHVNEDGSEAVTVKATVDGINRLFRVPTDDPVAVR